MFSQHRNFQFNFSEVDIQRFQSINSKLKLEDEQQSIGHFKTIQRLKVHSAQFQLKIDRNRIELELIGGHCRKDCKRSVQ